MKRLLVYALPLAALFIIVAALNAIANTTLSGLVTLPSPTFVMPGTIFSGQALRLGESSSTDPSTVNTFQRPVGSWITSRDGTKAWIKTSTFAGSGWEALKQGAQVSGNSFGFILTRAQSLTQISPVGAAAGVLTCVRDDFYQSPTAPLYVPSASGTATLAVSPSTSIVGGAVAVSTGATAASVGAFWTPSVIFGRPDTTKFYAAARFAITTAIDAQTKLIVSMGSASFTSNVGFGICGAGSTVNYEAFYDGAGTECGGTLAGTGVAYANGAKHLFEMWGLADGKVHFAVDQVEIAGSPFTMASSPVVSQRAGVVTINGATAAARTLEIDWWQHCWGET